MAKQMVKGFGISATDIIIGSPYMEIPNSAALLAKTIAEITGATYIRTHHQILHNEPYNEMSLADRLKLIAEDKLELDVKIQLPVVKTALKNPLARVLFIDDIFITGAHQLMCEQKLLYNNNLFTKLLAQNKVHFLYLYKNAGLAPEIEHKINNVAISSNIAIAKDLLWEQNSKMLFNSRNIKAVLKLPFESFKAIVDVANPNRLATFELLAYANKYNNFYSNLLYLNNYAN